MPSPPSSASGLLASTPPRSPAPQKQAAPSRGLPGPPSTLLGAPSAQPCSSQQALERKTWGALAGVPGSPGSSCIGSIAVSAEALPRMVLQTATRAGVMSARKGTGASAAPTSPSASKSGTKSAGSLAGSLAGMGTRSVTPRAKANLFGEGWTPSATAVSNRRPTPRRGAERPTTLSGAADLHNRRGAGGSSGRVGGTSAKRRAPSFAPSEPHAAYPHAKSSMWSGAGEPTSTRGGITSGSQMAGTPRTPAPQRADTIKSSLGSSSASTAGNAARTRDAGSVAAPRSPRRSSPRLASQGSSASTQLSRTSPLSSDRASAQLRKAAALPNARAGAPAWPHAPRLLTGPPMSSSSPARS